MSDRLSTGSEKLDGFLEGGYERGVITTIYGPSGTGKTTTCLLAAISCARKGKVIFIDTEGGFSTERLKQLTDDYKTILDSIFLLTPTNFVEQKHCVDSLFQALPKSVSIIICDTISSLYRVERADDNKGLNTELGRQVGKLLEVARKNLIPIILTNQVYSDFEKKSEVKMVGGDLLTYSSKCLIEFKTGEGALRQAILRKHRNLPQNQVGYEIRSEGIY